MLRFPNPGSDLDSLLRIYIAIFEELSSQEEFDLDDFSEALIERNLATSCGYTGQEALQRSRRPDRSRDPIYNQAKMYSELYKALGWLHPRRSSALKFEFTFFGAHVVKAQRDPDAIIRQSLLGICFPNSVLGVRGGHVLRPFKSIITTARDLGDLICRDEMIIGPLSLDNDRKSAEVAAMVEEIRALRGDADRLKKKMESVSAARGIAINTMHNYTRFPIGSLKWAGWVEAVRDSNIYRRSISFLRLTPAGIAVADELRDLVDVRSADLQDLDNGLRQSLIRLGFYQMLERSGFDVSPVEEELEAAQQEVSEYLDVTKPELLFSPFQELVGSDISDVFDYQSGSEAIRSDRMVAENRADYATTSTVVSLHKTGKDEPGGMSPMEAELREALAECGSVSAAIRSLMAKYAAANQTEFYPLIGRLMIFLGFPCDVSRAGVNYERWDAIIPDDERSIPIEIKSPGEEIHLSVKAVRQALENKVILLSRKTYVTDLETTTLAVGFRLPNDRSEVGALVEDIKQTYGISVGIIDLETLLTAAYQKVNEECEMDLAQFQQTIGFLTIEAA